jgi:hypothetical protein
VGKNAAAAARQLAVSRQFVSGVVAKARRELKERAGKSMRPDRTLPSDEFMSSERGPSDRGAARRSRVVQKF